MRRKSKKLFVSLVALVFVFGVMVTGAWADPTLITVTGNPGGSGTDPVANDLTAGSGALVSGITATGAGLAPNANNIIISEDAAGDLAVGSTITITAPAGTKFDLSSTLPDTNCKLLSNNAASDLRVGSTTAATYQTVTAEFSLDAATLTLLTVTASTDTSYVEVGGIRLIPTAASTAADTNTPDLPFTVYVQEAGKSYTPGQVDLLARPRIVSAVKTSNTTIAVTFNAGVSPATATNAATAFLVDPGSGTATAPTGAGSIIAGTSYAGVSMPIAAWDGAGFPQITMLQSQYTLVENFLNSGVTASSIATNKAYAPVPIKNSSSSSITSVSIDNENAISTLTGGKIGVQYLAGRSAMPMNTFTVTIDATAGEAYKVKIIRKSGTTYGRNGPMSVTNLTSTIGASAANVETGLSTAADTAAANPDIFWVSGTQSTGTVALKIVTGGTTAASNIDGFAAAGSGAGGYTAAAAVTAGDEVPIMVLASQDNFDTFTSSGYITVDKKAPVVISSGESAPVALSCKSVRLTWNEDMDQSTLSSASKWNIRDVTNSTNIPVTGVTVDPDGRTCTLTSTASFPNPGNVQAQVNGSLAVLSAIEDACANPANTTAGWQSVTGDITVPVTSPTITGFSPTGGGNGTRITITGSNFTCATSVEIGGTSVTEFTVVSDTEITAVVAANTEGFVSVTTPGGTATSSSEFTYTAVTAGAYHVDDDGNDNNAGTAAAPWKTLHYAIDQINGGDSGIYILIMAAGTYSIGNGEADSAITLSQSNVTIIGAHDLSIGASNLSTFIDGSDAATWTTGIQITDSDVSNVTIKFLTIRNFSSASGIYISDGSGNEVLGCKVHDNTRGIDISSSSDCDVKHCEIYNNIYGLYIYLSTGEIFSNIIHDNVNQVETGIGVFANNCSPQIKRNKIYDNNTGIRVESNNSNTPASPAIRNNVIYETTPGNMVYGISVLGFGDGTASPTIHHNSIDGGTGDGIAVERNATSTLEPKIKYNIITRCDVHGIDVTSGVTYTIDYNDVWHNGPNGRGLATDNYNGCTPGANDLTAGDGLGKDPENGTAGPLESTSPCIDAIPTDVGDTATMDYLGYNRPQGSGYDMGAYEYVAQQTYPDTLPGGTGVVTDYRIFTVPLDIGTGANMQTDMEGTLGTYNPATWRVFAYTTNGDVEMNTQAFASLDVKPGMGFWGITTLTDTINFTGTLAPDSIYYMIQLAPGWHLFAVPWPGTSIELGKIYVTDGVNQYAITDSTNTLTQQKIWDYTGTVSNNGYVERNATDFSLVAGTGYFINVGSSNIILAIPPNNISDPPNNSSASSSSAMLYESLESVDLPDDSEPPPLPTGSYGPMPDIKANGKSGPLTVSQGTPVSITVSLDPGNRPLKKADWWVVAHTPFAPPDNWYSYIYPDGWQSGIHACVQMLPFLLPPPFEVLNMALPAGEYTFYFALDENADGIVDETWKDSVEVRVE